MIAIDASTPASIVQRSGGPTLTRRAIWDALVRKANDAVGFVPEITSCEVIEAGEDYLVREIVLRGEHVRERVTFLPERLVRFDRLSGRALGHIINEIEEDEQGQLSLRYTLALTSPGLVPGGPAEQEMEQEIRKSYQAATRAILGNALMAVSSPGIRGRK